MYKIKVNDNYEFEISEKELLDLDAISTAENKFHILHQNASVKAEMKNADFDNKTYSIKINNNTYDVKINDQLGQLITEMGFSLSDNKKVDHIKAPMPGLILEINVKPGQEVKEDDALLILEAMKMENVITSPRDGVIKTVNVSQSDTVEKNTLLIEFE